MSKLKLREETDWSLRTGITNITAETDFSAVYIIYRGSTANEYPGIYGISHLMEHLMCDGAKHMEKDFQKYGITTNAYTSDSEIVFYISGLDEYIQKYREEWIFAIADHVITEERFLEEREVVMQEYNSAMNEQIRVHQRNLYRKLYGQYGPLGKREDLEALTTQDIENHHKVQFAFPSQIINVSKNNPYKEDPWFDDEMSHHDTLCLRKTHEFIVEGRKTYDQSTVVYLSPVVKDEFPIVKIICAMLGDDLISPLYEEIREKRGLIYFIWCYIHMIDDNSGVINIASEMEHGNVDEFVETVNMILENKEKYLTQERLDIIIENARIELKKSKILPHKNVYRWIEPLTWNIEEALNEGDITLAKIYEVFDKYFHSGNWHRSVDTRSFAEKETKID